MFAVSALLPLKKNTVNFQRKYQETMIKIDKQLIPSDLSAKLKRFWELSDQKIYLIENTMTNHRDHPCLL